MEATAEVNQERVRKCHDDDSRVYAFEGFDTELCCGLFEAYEKDVGESSVEMMAKVRPHLE